MSKPKPPPAPDYAGAAKAQGTANIDAARTSAKLSNPNVINPYGSQTVTYGANGDPDQATVTQTLSPEQQKLFDQDIRISQGMGDLAEGGIDRVGNMLGTSFDSSGLPALQTAGLMNFTPSMTGRIATDVAPTSIGIQSNIDPTAAKIQSTLGNTKQDVRYDFGSPSTAVKGAVDPRFDQSGEQVRDALYRQQASMLDPQYQQGEDDLRVRLANQGIMQGSEAYGREIDNFTRNRDAAYQRARDASILAAGNEQSRLYNMGLAGAGLANTANQQEFTQGLARAGFGNEAQAQDFAQLAARGQFGNEAQSQEFGQNASQAAFRNASQQQEFGQNLDRANFNNQAIGQMFGQQMAANNQNFNQDMTRSGFDNQARQQALQEALAMRQLPLNEINALRTGSQVTLPQFQQYQGQQVAAEPIFGAMQAQGQWDQGLYNAKTAQAGQKTQGMVGLAAAAAMAF